MTRSSLTAWLNTSCSLVLLGACAHGPSHLPATLEDLSSPTLDAGGTNPTRPSHPRSLDSLAISARALEALGRPEEAWPRWLEVARTQQWRTWALSRLDGLVDLVDLKALSPNTMLPQLTAWLPESAPLLRKVAWRLGDTEALRRAQTPVRYRASRRLLSWPGVLVTAAGLVGDKMAAVATDDWRVSHDGRIASPREGAGLYAFELDLAPGRHHLSITTEADLIIWLNPSNSAPERVVEHPALSRFLPTRLEFELELQPGDRLELHAADRSPQVTLSLLPVAPSTASRPAMPLSPHLSDAELLARCDRAILESDVDTSARLEREILRRLEQPHTRNGAMSALWRVELARLAMADRSRPNDRQRADAYAQLEEVLARYPEHLEALEMATRRELDDDPAAAMRRLAAFPAARASDTAAPTNQADNAPHQSVQWMALTVESLLASGERREAFALAKHLVKRLPTSCRARDLSLEAGFEDLRYQAPLEPVFAGAPVDRACLDLRWRELELVRETFALDRGRALLAPLLSSQPGEGLAPGPELGRAHARAAALELAAGQRHAALNHLREARRFGEDDSLLDELERRATPQAGRDATAERALSMSTREPLTDLMARLKKAPRPGPDSGGTLTLFRETRVHIHRDGALTLLEHVAVAPLDKKAIENLGEVVIPDGAEVLVARTWKASVSSSPTSPRGKHSLIPIEPEDLLEKDTISLPALAVGDVAEWAYVYDRPADPRISPAWVAPHVLFDSEDGPVGEARFVVTADNDALAPIFFAEPHTRAHLEELPSRGRRWSFVARDVPQAFPEPLTPHPLSQRVVLHVDAGPLEGRLYAAMSAELQHATRPSPAIETLIAEALSSHPPEQAPAPRLAAGVSASTRLRRVYDYLLESIEEPSEAEVLGPASSEASFVAHRRRGARTLALLAACRALSIRCELALARPIWEGPTPPYADTRAMSYPLVVHPDSGTWLDPSGRYNPFGVLPPALIDSPAIVLGHTPTDLATIGKTPALPASAMGIRKAQLDIELLDSTTFLAHGDETLDGAFGASWRFVLAPLQYEHRQRVLTSVVQQVLPGATIEEVEVTGLDSASTPLFLRWRARGSTQPAGGSMASLGIALFPESLARSTVHLSSRDTPLLVNLAVALDLTVRIKAPPRYGFPSVPRDLKVEYGPLRFERRSAYAEGGRTVTLTKTMTLHPTIIAPSEYTAWRDAAQAVDRADLVQLIFGPGTSGPEPSTPSAASGSTGEPPPTVTRGLPDSPHNSQLDGPRTSTESPK